jgi:DNA-binding CsgD family transcriptional regulator
VKTVDTHRKRIKEKLGLTDGAALQRRAALFEARQEAAHHGLGSAVPAA